MQVFENFLDKDYENNIKTALTRIPWYYDSCTCDFSYIHNFPLDIPHVMETPFFYNMLVNDFKKTTDDAKYFLPIIGNLEKVTGRRFRDRLFRIKSNLYTKQPNYPNDCYHTPHVDVYDEKTDKVGDGEIFLYYADDSDGDTFFFNERFGSKEYTAINRLTPEKGKGALFDMSIVHASSPPRYHDHRITLNFVFRR